MYFALSLSVFFVDEQGKANREEGGGGGGGGGRGGGVSEDLNTNYK